MGGIAFQLIKLRPNLCAEEETFIVVVYHYFHGKDSIYCTFTCMYMYMYVKKMCSVRLPISLTQFFQLSLLFIFLFFIFGWNISIIETLQNPILSDQFGLTIENTSYVFIGVTAIYFVSVVFM